MASSVRLAAMSLIMHAPARRASRATPGLTVSMESGTAVAFESFSSTGITRRNSSASLTDSAPGREDSPPTSMMSAPSSTRRKAWTTAASVSPKRAPSKKESGVALTTPINKAGRGNSNSNWRARKSIFGGGAESIGPLFGRGEILGHLSPVHRVPDCLEIIGATILILEVISVLPNIDAEDGLAFASGDGFAHDRIILVGSRADFQFSPVDDQPSPAAAESAHACRFDLFLQSVKAAEGRRDCIAQGTGGGAASFWSEQLPEHGMIGMAAAVIAHRAANVRRDGVEIANQLLHGFLFQVRLACDGFVEVGHVSRVMFVMVDLHGLRVDIGFERVFCVGERR